MINKETIQHLAKLARIELTPEREEQLTKDVSKILAYVEDLKAVDTEGLSEISQVTGLKNINRPDLPVDCDADTIKRILEAMPAREGNYLKVKAIFDN